jgi:hypothetical protein
MNRRLSCGREVLIGFVAFVVAVPVGADYFAAASFTPRITSASLIALLKVMVEECLRTAAIVKPRLVRVGDATDRRAGRHQHCVLGSRGILAELSSAPRTCRPIVICYDVDDRAEPNRMFRYQAA